MGRKSRGKKLKRMEREEAQQATASGKAQETPASAGGPNPPGGGSAPNFSDVLVNFLLPVLDPTMDDIDDIKAKMTWGVMIWNKAVADAYPAHPVSEQVAEQFPLFMLMVPDEELVTNFLERKKQFFAEQKFFIMEHQAKAGQKKGEISLSVSVLPVEGK